MSRKNTAQWQRPPSPATLARQERARRNRDLVLLALESGRRLRVGVRTSLDNGTVHHGLARLLVREGRAEYGTYPSGTINRRVIEKREAQP